jgi:5-formyltetrahydrofolate cyclo-ligase
VDYTKVELRKMIRDSRAAYSAKPLLISALLESPNFKDATVVASYFSYGTEPDTKEMNLAIIAAGKVLLLPKLLSDNSLVFIKWDGKSESLDQNGKVAEPKGEPFVGEIDLMILPALAIDKSGNRLGQGGGSYDRIKSIVVKFKVAAINESELVELIPVETHDLKVDAVLTPGGLLNLN